MSARVRRLAVVLATAALLPLDAGPAAAAAAAPPAPAAVVAEVDNLAVRVSWTPPADTSGITGYRVSTVPAGLSIDLPPGADSAVLAGVRPNTPYVAQVAALAGSEVSPVTQAEQPVTVAAPGGSLTAVPPARLLDTRSGLGAPPAATRQVTLTVTGRGGIPSADVAAVALNLTVTQPLGPGFVTAYPGGTARPTASNLNFLKGQTVSNLVVVPVGPEGTVVLYSSVVTHLVADAAGWFSTAATASPAAGLFHGLSPARLADTRTGLGGTTPGPDGRLDLQVTGAGGVPTSGVSAVVLNTTVAGSTAAGFVTAFPAGQPRPTASTVNFAAKQVLANRVIVPVGSDGKVSFYNRAGSTPLVVDVTGWFGDGSDPAAGGAYLASVPPTRIVDTRTGLGAAAGPVAGGVSLPVAVAGRAGLPAASAPVPATGLIANVTAVAPTNPGFLTVYPSLTERPTASDLNFTAGAVVPNLSVAPLGVDGATLVYNHAGATHVVIDVVGYFLGDTATPSSTRQARPGDVEAVTGTPGNTRQVVLTPAAAVPEIGEVLAAGVAPATPDGLLVKVVDTGTDAAGNPVLTTEPATLQEAFGAGHFSVSAPLSADDVTPAGTAPGGKPALTPERLQRRLAARESLRAVAQPIDRAVSCSGGGSVRVVGSVSVSPSVNLSVEWGWFSVKSATFTGTLSQDASLTASAQAASGCNLGPVPLLPTPVRFTPITFSIGPVPVVVTPQLQFYLSANGTVSAQVTAAAIQRASGTLGLSWSDAGLRPIAQTSSSFSYTPPTPSASASLRASVGPRLELFLYGLAGPYLTAGITVELSANPTAEPWWTLTGGLDAGAGIALPSLGFDKSNPSILRYRKVLARAPLPQHLYVVECVSSDCYTTLRLVQTDDRGGARRQIGGTYTGGGLGLAVNPAGTEVVYRRAAPGRGLTLFVRNIATGQDRQLTYQDPTCSVDTFDKFPVWSPNGATISFSRSSSFGWYTCPTDGIYTVPASGGTPTRISTRRDDGPPSWNPGNSRWAVTTATQPPTLYTSASNGSGKQTVYTGRSGEGFSPAAWSPDGSTIAFGTHGGAVYGYSPAGARLWSLTPANYCTGYPVAWARDSASLFYLGCQSSSLSRTIYRVNAASGSTPTPIVFERTVEAVAVGR
ncbi:fibronectin type III domain-containing protein [Micromonospora echinaurantiaca]|uniref:fibronectin type III domain-containing protein n=1 Tax=Micromonospora echinaurantiaca TaxID=47857 RepID=UPI00343E7E5C